MALRLSCYYQVVPKKKPPKLFESKNITAAIIPIIITILALGNLFLYLKVKSFEKPNTVIKITDGDTFILGDERAIRLLGVEAPEVDLCGGKEAKEFLEKLVLGKTVRLEETTLDRFQRIIGLVYVGRTLVNEEILRWGLARYDGSKNTQRERIKKAFDKAKSENLGIFSLECYQKENPKDAKCDIKGNISRAHKTKIYHFPGCSEYERSTIELDLGEQWFCTEEEAESAGYTKAANCLNKSYQREDDSL